MSSTLPSKKPHLLDDLIAVCVSHGLTDDATAEVTGSSSRTVRRRRNEPEVTAKVAELVSQRAAAVELQLSNLGTAAIEVFEDAMSSENEMGYRLAGANSTMRNLNAAKNTANLELRVRELEAEAQRLGPLLERLEEIERSRLEAR